MKLTDSPFWYGMTQTYSFYVDDVIDILFYHVPRHSCLILEGVNHITSTDLPAALFQDHNRRAMSHQL